MFFCLIHVQQRSVIDLSHPPLLPQFTNFYNQKIFIISTDLLIRFNLAMSTLFYISPRPHLKEHNFIRNAATSSAGKDSSVAYTLQQFDTFLNPQRSNPYLYWHFDFCCKISNNLKEWLRGACAVFLPYKINDDVVCELLK